VHKKQERGQGSVRLVTARECSGALFLSRANC
jgi:hypothetical protein